MLNNLTLEIILIILVVIIVPIIIYMIHRWIKKAKEKKGVGIISENAITQGYTVTEKPKNKNQKPYTLSGGKSIQVANAIEDHTHTFGEDDVISILSLLKDNVRTKTDMAMVEAQLRLLDVAIYEVMNKGLKTIDQKKKFSSWLGKLPEYI